MNRNTRGVENGYIPAEPIVKLVKEHLLQLQYQSDHGYKGNTTPAALGWLAKRANLNPRALYAYLHGERESMSFNNADKLLCVLDSAHLWYCEPLASYYESVRLAD